MDIMGIRQPFRTSANWDQAISLLDTLFPLTQGSHGTVKGYLMHFDHLVVIQANGDTCALQNPSQFVQAGGDYDAPTSIFLEQDGLQVEIEPACNSASVTGCNNGHRMQLLTTIATA